jgi:hypothetical protein
MAIFPDGSCCSIAIVGVEDHLDSFSALTDLFNQLKAKSHTKELVL